MLAKWLSTGTYVGRRLVLEQLEDRIVLDAAVVTDANGNFDQNQPESQQNPEADQEPDAQADGGGADSNTEDASAPLEDVFSGDLNVVLISNCLDKIEAISQAVVDDAEVIVFDGETGGFSTVAEQLQSLVDSTGKQIGQIAILSHGSPGALILGESNVYSIDSLTQDSASWLEIGEILAEDARIDLYACEIGIGQIGWTFVDALAETTGIDVWASDDATGGPDGDWDLEVKTGESDRGFLIDGSSLDDLGISLAPISPVAYDQTVTPNPQEDVPYTITVTGHDGKDPARGDVTFDIVVEPSHGTLTPGSKHYLGDGSYSQDFTYTPDPDYNGEDSFQFTVTTPYAGPWQEFDGTVGEFGSSADRTRSIAVGDIDNDGDLDIVVGTPYQAYKIYTNDGTGSFTYSHSVSSGNGWISSVELGDIDNDGDLDFIGVGHFASSRIFKNDGTGVFTYFGRLDSTSLPMAEIRLADIDSDGDLDAVVANGSKPNKVYTNDGTGVFSLFPEFRYDYDRGMSLDVGDIDGDGDLDVVVGNEDRSANKVFKNDGTGVFTYAGYIKAYSNRNTSSIQLGDLDGDGDLDVVTGNWGASNYVFLNNGTGSFSYSNSDINSSATADLRLGDVDHDGDLDVVTGNFDSANVVFLNNGNGRFSNAGAIDSNADKTYSIQLADFDNDGFLDVISGNEYAVNTVTFNNGREYGNPSFELLSTAGTHTDLTNSIQVGDIDGDGDWDLIRGNDGVNRVYTNDGSGVFTYAGMVGTHSDTTYSIQFGDVDGDGDLDVIAGNDGVNRLYLNDGSGTFADSGNIGTHSDTTYSIQFGDVDGDGDLDVLAGNDGVNRLYLNDGSGTFADAGTIGTHSDTTCSIQFGDVDGDGDLDVIAGNDGVNRLYLNDGSGTFADSGTIGTLSDTTNSIQFGDVDRDGDLDVIAGNDGVNRLYLNDGNGTFADAGTIGDHTDATYSIQLMDENHDGYLDVVTGNGSGVTRLYVNDGEGNFTYWGDISSDVADTRSIQVCDVNRDGNPDVAVGNYGSNHAVYARPETETSAAATVTLTIDPLNDEPIYTGDTTVTADEDVPAEITISGSDGDPELDQTLSFWLKGGTDLSNGDLYKTESDALNRINAIDLSGGDVEVDWGSSVWYMSDPDANANTSFDVYVTDDGGTDRGGDDTSPDYTVSITVQPVNDEPTYTGTTTVAANEDVPAEITMSGSDGDPEVDQTLSYWLRGGTDLSNGDLYRTESDALNRINAIDLSGGDVEVDWGTSVWYMSDPDVNGNTSFEVYVTDDGGTDRGGDDTSPDCTVNITVQPVNDEPMYTGTTTVTADEDVPAEITISGSDGDPELDQTLSYWLKGGTDLSNGDLYRTESDALNRINAIDLSGGDVEVDWGTSVWYMSDPDANANTSFDVYVTDDGGTDRGGDDTSPDYTVGITVQPVNDEPMYTGTTTVAADEDVPAEITISGADGDPEVDQTLSYWLRGGTDLSNGDLYRTESDALNRINAIDLSGGDVEVDWGSSVWYMSDPDANGNTSFVVYVTDDGGTDRGGDDTSPDNTVNITVQPVNDEPTYTGTTTVTTDEDVPAEITMSGSDGDPEVDQTLSYWLKGGTDLSNGDLYRTESDALNRIDAIDLSGGDVEVDWGSSVWYMSDPDANGNTSFVVYVTDDGGTDRGGDDTSPDYTVSITVQPVNDEPVIDSLSATSTNEDGVVHLTGTYSDADTGDTHTLTINWGEGADQTVVVTAGSFDITHRYLDDNPTGTPSDVYTIKVTLTDGYGGTDTQSTTTTITNLAPVLNSLFATSVDEGGVIHLTGTYSDVGSEDIHLLTIDWGEGAYQTVAVTSGSFDITHRYLDDNPTGTAADEYTIKVTLSDDDTGTDTGSTTTTITNVAPIITLDPVSSINENQVATLTGTITDPGKLDTFVLTINWGDPLSANNIEQFTFGASASGIRTFTLTHQYDNPAVPPEMFTILATVIDDDTGITADSKTIVVNPVNDAPELTAPTSINAAKGSSVTVAGLSVADVDSTHPIPNTATYEIEVTLSVEHGTLTLTRGHGLAMSSGADGTASMTFTGTLDQINVALSELVYTPDDDYIGSDSLTITVDDLGNFGSGGPCVLDRVTPINIENVDEFYLSAKPYLDEFSDLTDGNGMETGPLSTVETMVAIDNLLDHLTEEGLLPSLFTDDQGVDADTPSDALSQFGILMHEALFGNGSGARTQAWENLLSLVEETKEHCPECLELEPFLSRLREWHVGKSMDDIRLDFNAGEIRLAEWFNSLMGSADGLLENQGGTSVGLNESLQKSVPTEALVFNLDSLRVQDLLAREMNADWLSAGTKPVANPHHYLCRVFDLDRISFAL
jgi:hypothetical protein